MTNRTTCRQCGKRLTGYRPQARFCSPAHRAAYQRSTTANKAPRVRFLRGRPRDRAAVSAGYVSIVRRRGLNDCLGQQARLSGDLSDPKLIKMLHARGDEIVELLGNSGFWACCCPQCRGTVH